MATQNIVSASISAELKESINQSIAELKSKCSFVVTLTPEEIKGLFKANDGYSAFLKKAFNAFNDYPQLMSLAFDKEEFVKDYTFADDLGKIVTELESFVESLRNTLTAALSDTMLEALEVYAAVKQNKDKIPGLNTVYDDMAKHFKRTRTVKEEPK